MPLRLLKTRPVTIGAVLVAALAPGLVGTSPVAAVAAPATSTAPAPPAAPSAVVAPEDRDTLLSTAWKTSADVAWTTSGDAVGFHLLMADAQDGYAWPTGASVSAPGIETDQWVGNACVTGSGRRAVLVYAPRHF